MDINTRMREMLAKEGVSQHEMAKSMGVSQPTVSNYLTAERISYRTVERFASILGYDLKWVKRGVDEEKVSSIPNPLMDVPGAEKLTVDDLNLIRMMVAGLVAQKG